MKQDIEWSVIIANISDYDQFALTPPHCQFVARVDYVRGDNATRWIEFSGFGGTLTEPVPTGMEGDPGSVNFTLTFGMDTTDCTIRAELKNNSTGGATLVEATPRYYVNFLCGGMGAAPQGGPAEWKTEVAAAGRAAAGRNTIPAGLYRGHFRQFDKLFRACARVLVQGEPILPAGKKGAPPCRPLKLEYDLPADLHWYKVGNKYQPFWSFCNLSPLAAARGFRTILRPVLLNADGKVEAITTHPF